MDLEDKICLFDGRQFVAAPANKNLFKVSHPMSFLIKHPRQFWDGTMHMKCSIFQLCPQKSVGMRSMILSLANTTTGTV